MNIWTSSSSSKHSRDIIPLLKMVHFSSKSSKESTALSTPLPQDSFRREACLLHFHLILTLKDPKYYQSQENCWNTKKMLPWCRVTSSITYKFLSPSSYWIADLEGKETCFLVNLSKFLKVVHSINLTLSMYSTVRLIALWMKEDLGKFIY